MQALVVILNKIEYTQTVVQIMKQSGIRGATIVDGIGGGGTDKGLNTTSFLANIVMNLEQRNKVKKIVFSVVEKEIQVKTAVDRINEEINENKGDQSESGAFMFTLPINYMRGGELERHIIRRDGKYV